MAHLLLGSVPVEDVDTDELYLHRVETQGVNVLDAVPGRPALA